MSWFSDIWSTTASNWVHGYVASEPSRGSASAILPNMSYLHIDICAMRIAKVRKGLSKFYGAAHSSMSVAHRKQEKLTFEKFTSPDKWRNIDAGHIDRMISGRHRLLGPVPYRGGGVMVDVGLFSIRSADLAGPYVSLLESISKQAGVAFVTAALPFVSILREGLKAVAEKDALETGLSSLFDPPKLGFYAVVGASSGEVSLPDLSFDTEALRLKYKSKPIQNWSYLVLDFQAKAQRDDFFLIPEVKKAYDELVQKVRDREYQGADDALKAFSVIVRTCPDLIAEHAKKLVEQVEGEIKDLLPQTSTAKSGGRRRSPKALRLFSPF